MKKVILLLIFVLVGLVGFGQTTIYSLGQNLSCSNYVSGSGIGLVLEQPSATQFKFYIVKRLSSSCGINPSGNFSVAGIWNLYTYSGTLVQSASVSTGTGYSSAIFLNMPSSFTSGSQSYYATLTSSGSTFSTSNGGYVSINATTNYPNLTTTIKLLTPNTGVNPGNSVIVNSEVTNNGTVTAGSSVLNYYLSNNNTYSSDDIYLGQHSVPSLLGVGSTTFDQICIIPANTTIGSYYIITVADATNIITESNENDNIDFKFIDITGTPELQLGSCTNINPNPLVQGQNKSFSYSVKNIGTGTFTGKIRLTVLKPNSTIPDVVDEQLLQTIAPNEIKLYTSSVTILDAATNPVGTNYQFTVQSIESGSSEVNTVAAIAGCTNPIITSVVAASTCAYTCSLNKTLSDFPNTGNEGLCAANYLCNKGIIQTNQSAAPSSLVLREDLAKMAFLSILDDNSIPIYVANPSSFSFASDYFPTPYLDLTQNMGTDNYQRYAKILSYLEYTDGKAPFDRRNTFNPKGNITRGDVLKVLLETWNIDESTSTVTLPYTDVLTSNANYQYIRKAYELGIILNSSTFRPNENCKREELFVMLKRLRELTTIAKPLQSCLVSATNACNYFFTPANNNVFNLNMPKSIAEGSMPASIGGFSIPDIGFTLGFSGNYGSTLTELPDEWRTIEPLGAGWSHPYNAYAFIYNQEYFNSSTNTVDSKQLLAFAWGDGIYNVYDRTNSSNSPTELTLPSYYTLTAIGTNQYTIKTKGQVTYTFTKQGSEVNFYRLSAVTDRYGNNLSLVYKTGTSMPNSTLGTYNMVLDYVQAPSGRRVTFNYDTQNQITQVIFPGETVSSTRQFTMTYDNKRLKTFINAKGKTTVFDYASNDITNKAFKLINKITLPKGNFIQATYNESNKLKTLTENTLTTNITPPSNYSTSGGYNGLVTSSNLVQTSTTFNKNGVPTAVNSPTINVSVTPDALHPTQPASISHNGKTGSYTYFANGNIQRVTYSDGTFEEYTYDSYNNVASHKDARGNTTVYNNSTDGKFLQSINQPSSSGTLTQSYGYNNVNGLLLSSTNNESIATNYSYDSNTGNLIGVTIPILNISSSSTYDYAGRLKTNTNAKNQTTTYLYDLNDNLVGEKDAQNHNTTYDFDDNDKLTVITNAKGQQTVMTYDEYDRLKQESFDNKNKSYNYNATTGLLESFIKPSSSSFNYTYDANKLLKSNGYITNIDYEPQTFYLKNISGGTNQNLTNFSYDNLGRMTAYTDHYNQTIGYGYDANNNITRIDYPNNQKAYYEYDEANRLRTVRWNSTTGTPVAEYIYAGTRLSYVQYGNGVRTNYGYDNAGRPNALTTKTNNGTGTTIFASSYTMDNLGNHLEENETHPFPTIPTPTAGTTNYTYTQGNRIQTAGSTSFVFNDDGNTATKTGNGFSYDIEDNLTSVTGNATINYEYDAFGNRRKAVRNGTETRYVLDISGDMANILAETNASNATQNYYLHGLGLVARIKPDGTLHYYHPDFRGSVIAMTDANQTISHKYQYDEFGNLTNSQEADFNPFRYVGALGVMHETNDLTFMRVRYYDPTIGRFMSEDPIWATNLYPYANNNGVMNVDAGGEAWKDLLTSENYEKLKTKYENINKLIEFAYKLKRTRKFIAKTAGYGFVGNLKKFTTQELKFTDFIEAGLDTDLGKQVIGTAPDAWDASKIIYSHIKNGDFMKTFIADAKTSEGHKVLNSEIYFGPELAKTFIKSFGQATLNLSKKIFKPAIDLFE